MINIKKYNNGLRVIVDSNEYVRSVSMGILVGVGSCFETKNENGISHFIEHVNFKGTEKRNAFEISDSIDRIGAQIDAFTSKDLTCYYVKSTDEHVTESFEILSDLFCNSIYPSEELEKERGVIIEEINMSDDSPDDLCLDLLAEAYFGKRGFGATILGPISNVKSFNRADVLSYKRKYYTPDNIVISFAGHITLEHACELVEKFFIMGGISQKTILPRIEDACRGDNLFANKKIEQNHIAIGFPGVSISNKNRLSLICLNAIFGGGMSSRLFQTIREKMGLAYSVFSFMSSYKDLGVISVYAGVNPSKKDTAYECLISEIHNLAQTGVTQDELLRAKEQIKGSTVLSRENMASIMISQGKRLLLTNDILDIDAELDNISALKLNEVNEIASIYFQPKKIATAIVGDGVKAFH